MSYLDTMKALLNISEADTSKDIVLNFFIIKSQNAIKNFLNIEIITEDLFNQVVDLAIFYYKQRDHVGLTSNSQGSRSQSTVDGIPQNIKDTLPLPKLRVLGG